MRPALILATLLTAFALPVAAQDATARYAVDVTVMEAGVEIASGRTIIVEGGQAQVLLHCAAGEYNFEADLQIEQGDGADDRVILEAYFNHDGVDLAKPNMIMKRGGTARMQIGAAASTGATLTDGVEIEISPIPTT